MTRKSNNRRQTHSSTWLWGTEGTGAAFVGTKICSLAAEGFGSFVKPSIHTSDSSLNEEGLATEVAQPISTFDPLSTTHCSISANDCPSAHLNTNSLSTISSPSTNTSLADSSSSSENNSASSPSVSGSILSKSTPTTTKQNPVSHVSTYQGLYIIYSKP